MVTLEAIIVRLRQRRKALGLTQNDVAIRAGITTQAISSWENLDRSPNSAYLLKWAEAVGVDFETIPLQSAAPAE